MSILDGGEAPETTGSIAEPVSVQQPLPATLAYSDATRIGQAATVVLAQAQGAAAEEWVNATTGSSGTLQAEASGGKAGSENCRHFSTIVTSVGGVHRYSGAICRNNTGAAIVQLDERSQDQNS